MIHTIKKRLDERYAASGRIHQLKAGILFSVNLFLSGAVLLLLLLYIVQGRTPVRIGMLALLVVVFLLSDYLVYRGRLRVAGAIHIYSLLLLLTLLRFLVGDSLYELQSHTAIMAIVIFDAAMVHTEGRSLVVTGFLGVLSVLSVFLLAPLLRPEIFSFGDLLGPAILAVVLTGIALAIARALFTLSAGVVGDLERAYGTVRQQYDRLRELFGGFNHGLEISDRLRVQAGEASGSVREVESQSEGSRGVLEEFQAALENLNRQSATLKEQSSSLEERMTNQSAFVEEATAAVEEMNSSIQNMTKISRDRSGQVSQLVETAEEGAGEMARSEEAMRAIAESSKRMLDFVQMISKIAAQSNMLAMNASIEAAHAGVHGAGFAVVADEIRELSETSSKYAKQIAEALKSTAADVEQAGAINAEAAALFSTIHDGVAETNETFQELISGLSELSQGSREILDSVTQLRETTTQVTEASKEGRRLAEGGAEATEQLEGVATRLAEATDKTIDAARRLSGIVATFEEISEENREQLTELNQEAHLIYDEREEQGATPEAPTRQDSSPEQLPGARR